MFHCLVAESLKRVKYFYLSRSHMQEYYLWEKWHNGFFVRIRSLWLPVQYDEREIDRHFLRSSLEFPDPYSLIFFVTYFQEEPPINY